MNCTNCDAPLTSPIEVFGDYDAPMCRTCHFARLNEPDIETYFTYDDLGNGWLLKRLTAVGAAFLGGTPGQAVMRFNRAKGEMMFIGDVP